ncbi:uncharacterized protein LOC130681252 [Manis pentadactyla]|uniref:uncharacterized protein LOC130681252 n=1 Tax=Manis pentadactyla TaxID=143292 RepID=UPI00255D07B3|nr:uncharacterized protein LOC130681252 [Manis pentadactyla]
MGPRVLTAQTQPQKKEKETTKVYPDTQDLLMVDDPPPPPYPPAPTAAPALPAPPALAPSVPDAEAVGPAPGPAQGTRRRRGATLDPPGIFPLRSYGVPILGEEGDPPFQPLQYCPFSSADLYNWKANHPPFSDEPQKLTSLVESLMFSHQPTWDNCQQPLQVLFTTEERERILLEARRNVPGTDGRPSQLPHDIERGFPLTRPNWDFNSPEGRERLTIYRQALVAGLRGAARCPTNLAKVREVSQGATEAPTVFLERLIEAFRWYTPFDPTSEGHSASVALAFIGQSAPDIRKKLQRLEGLQDLSLRDLVKEAEKVYHKRETEEEKELRKEKERESKEEKRDKKYERNLTKILAAVVESKLKIPE